MMDEFYEYWELIPGFEKYEKVGKEIVKYKRNLQDPDISARDLPKDVIEFFQQHLISHPYPTWDILYHIIDIRNQEKNRLLEELVLDALSTLIDLIIEHPEQLDKKHKLYNLLSNIYVSEWCMNRVRDNIVPKLYDLKVNRGLLDDVLLLALLSRSVQTLLTQYMNYERQQIIEKCQMKAMFLRACCEKVHWIGTLLKAENDDAICSMNHKVYHHLKFFRLILNMGNVNYYETLWRSELDSIDASVIQSESVLDLCYGELQRLKHIFDFEASHHHDGTFDDKMLVKNHILNNLLSFQIDVSIQNYEAIRDLLKVNEEINEHQLKISHEPSYKKRTEVDLLNEYMIIKLYLNIVQSNDATHEMIDEQLTFIRMLLIAINDGNLLFRLMQNVYTLVFLRFEHIRKTKRKRKNSEMQSGSISNQNNSLTTDVSDTTVETLQSGFVCLKTSLKAILNSMRLFLIKLDQLEFYQTCDIELKLKFARILKSVNNTLWRLTIIENESQKKVRSTQSIKEWIKMHDHDDYNAKVATSNLEVTSDDEKNPPKKKVYRKKLKKRPKVAMKSDENDEASDDPVEFQLVTETSLTENSEHRTQSRSIESQRRVRSIISRLVMDPESLVTVCMLRDDHESVEKVIQEYNLQESDAAEEIAFIRSFKETKEKLKEIVMNFKKIMQREASSMSQSIEIDEIKNVAESGFEKAKFLNVLDKFTLNYSLKARDSDARVIEKASKLHPNLRMYQGELLNVLPMIDFMISLPCPFELNHNIYKYIMKQWNITEVEDGCFGYPKLLKNLIDVLTIFKNHNIEMSIVDLMNDEIFTIDPVSLKKQLENRHNVLEMMQMSVHDLDNDLRVAEVLNKFDLFDSERNFLARVVCYLKNMRKLLKFQTNESFGVDEIMKMNLYDIIGKIIFIQQYSPEQVENFAYNVNVNLIHAIAVCGTGVFWSPNDDGDEKMLSLFHLSEIGATSVNPELHIEPSKDNYIVNNADILYYIKREGSFMVAYLVKEIQNVDYKTLKYENPNFIERMMELKPIVRLMSLFNNNRMLSLLNYDHIDIKLILKKIKATTDLNDKLKILNSISERQWNRNRLQYNELKDAYVEMLITNDLDGSQEKFAKLQEIGNIRKFSELLLKCIDDVKSDDDAERLLRWCLNPMNASQLDQANLSDLKDWMKKLKIYRKIVKMFNSDENSTDDAVTWAKIKELADEKPSILVNYLININMNLVLCLEFLSIHPLKRKTDEITKMWVEMLNNKNLNEHHHLLFKIIDTFPLKNVIEFFDFALGFIHNLPSMIRVINFLNQNCTNVPTMNRIRYQKFLISTKIFECLEENEGTWNLASRPLVILEQFLMNSKIEILKNVIKNLRTVLTDDTSCSSCASTSSNMFQVGENLIYDFDAHHDDLLITNECVDLLLKLYAAKALDFQIIEVHSVPASTEVSSLDSSFTVFQIPKEIPTKQQWIPDGDTNHCMCCRRQKFSLLTRRHHCRRCGRVVCASCSQNRSRLESVYSDLMVRVCIDCYHQIDVKKKRSVDGIVDKGRNADDSVDWKLTGDISSDQMVRDEFNFEYSPNVGLCIAIIDLHTSNSELGKFFLFHCHRLELLLRPIRGKINPEVDLILVAKMLKCLAFSAKVRGANSEANAIIDHADVVLKVTENGCESIATQIPMEPVSSVTIRTIMNDLIKAENWRMALELSVKWDRSGTAGVFSAWGVSAIKSGQYRFAREKIALALQPVSGASAQANQDFIKMLNDSTPVDETMFNYKRSSRSPPLLNEVLESLEATANKRKLPEPIRSPVNTKFQPIKESSKNVLNVMENLKKIAEGNYGPSIRKPSDKFDWHSNLILNSPYYEESIFYLVTYGGNIDFLTLLMRNNLVPSALRYVLAQQVPHDLFIQYVFVPIVKVGRLEDFMNLVKKMDPNIDIWREYIIAACKSLERKHAFNCLYQMQILTGDLVRAALTCIKFYLDGSGNYTELNAKSHHLNNAKSHLQTELEKTECKKSEKHETGKKDSITLKWDLKTINAHINIISLQLETAKYLSKCEAEGLPTIGLMPKIFMDKPGMKTMFGKTQEKNQVAILLLVCGHSIESGFGISYKVIQECSLKSTKIYSTCTKYLARNLQRLMEVEKLVESIKANAANEGNIIDGATMKTCDELIAMSVEIAYNQHQAAANKQIEQLIKHISSKHMKIQCYINSEQLKAAYMLSASMNSYDDIRRIMKQAENKGQHLVRRLCEKKLTQRSIDSTRSSDSQSQGSKSDINQL